MKESEEDKNDDKTNTGQTLGELEKLCKPKSADDKKSAGDESPQEDTRSYDEYNFVAEYIRTARNTHSHERVEQESDAVDYSEAISTDKMQELKKTKRESSKYNDIDPVPSKPGCMEEKDFSAGPKGSLTESADKESESAKNAIVLKNSDPIFNANLSRTSLDSYKKLNSQLVTINRKSVSDVDEITEDSDLIRINIIKVADQQRERKKLFSKPIRKIKVNTYIVNEANTEKIDTEGASVLINNIEEHNASSVHSEEKAKEEPAQPERNANCTISELISEASRRTSAQKNQTAQKPKNRYVLNREASLIKLEDVIEINNLENRPVYSKIRKRCMNGGFTRNFVAFASGNVICYKSKPVDKNLVGKDQHAEEGNQMRQNEIATAANGPQNAAAQDAEAEEGQTFPGGYKSMKELEKYLIDPSDSTMAFPIKYSFDITKAKLYISGHQNNFLSFFCCCSNFIDRSKLVDISNSHIRNVQHIRRRYRIEIAGDDVPVVVTRNLDLVFETGEGYLYYYRIESIESFLKWILLYHMRKEREICKI
ncbi:hypothetical protein ENBRE01_1708 [Enteropsectra breve]|nr:hypothetical protein ENBRE01_1708 [Enteropsectra breve]